MEDKTPHNSVLNLSKTTKLSSAELSLLDKGMSFIPYHKVKKWDNKLGIHDLTRYHRRLKLAFFFEDDDNDDSLDGDIPRFTPPSQWEPRDSKIPRNLKKLITRDLETLTSLVPHDLDQRHNNLTESEQKAMHNLTKKDNLVLKVSDKSNTLVVMDRDEYVTEALRQLNDSNFYVKLEKPIFQDTASEYLDLLFQLRDQEFISDKQLQYLRGAPNPRARTFYLLPKIHKEKTKWSSPHMPPGRPIVSDCSSESYQIAEYLEYHLHPLSDKHPSYLKDTYDFIEKVKHISLNQHDWLFTIDIDSLYTNIETERGLLAVKKAMQMSPNPNRPDQILLRLLELSLTRNDFEFNGDFYLQTRGTAMGKRFAPSYANIYMADWEASVLSKCPLKPKFYFRFLDDIYGVWPHGNNTFPDFITILNNHHPYIKVKFELNYWKVNFLDTTTFRQTLNPTSSQPSGLHIKVYFKPTDTHALLHKQSYHPKHTFPAIIKAQLTRFWRICSQEKDFHSAVNILFRALKSRGYSSQFLNRTRRQWLYKKSLSNISTHNVSALGRKIPLILPYSATSQDFAQKLRGNLKQVFINENLTLRVITAYRRQRNLKDFLIKSRLKALTRRTNEKIHHKTKNGRFVVNRTTHKAYACPYISLNTTNCIYLITCHKCKIQYVGQTKNSIRSRLHHHTHNIRTLKKSETHLVNHFLEHGVSQLRIQGLSHEADWTLGQRLKMEKSRIKKLSTFYPTGLNQRQEV